MKKVFKVPYICKACKETHFTDQKTLDRGRLYCSRECYYNDKGITKVDNNNNKSYNKK